MADNVIDLNRSPPPPSWSSRSQRIIRLRALSSRAQSRRAIRALCLNPYGCYIHQRIASWIQRRLATLNCALSRISNRFHDGIHDDQLQAAIAELGSTSLYPHLSNLNEAWTAKEHELFLTGMIKYYRRRLSKIAMNFMWNTTTPQVQSYAESFFEHQPSTYSYSWKNMDQIFATTIAADLIRRNENLMAASNIFSNPMIYNEPQPTLTLFREEALLFSIPSADEGNSNTQIQTGVDSALLTGSDEVDLDLELSLG